MKKARTFVRAFLSQPSGEVEGLNYANACPAGFCLRQKFISPTSHRDKKRGKSFNLPLFYLNPLAKSKDWTTLTLALRVFAFGKNSFPRLRRDTKKEASLSTCLSFISTLWSEVDELNYANACPSGFCLRQKFISPTSQRYKKRGKSFNLPLFYLNPLERSRWIELR